MKTNILFLLVFLFITNISFGQDRTIQGIIHTLDSIPLIGVEIQVKSTKQVFITDSVGNFTIICSNEDKLRVRANGFYDQKVRIKENTRLIAINMKLKPGKKQRNYAIGYGYVSEENRTGAVTNMNSGDTKFSRFSNMYDLIRSMGVQVNNGEVVIRGSKTFQGSDAALIIVDDIIVDSDILKILRPIDIKAIDIIKDGTTSVYGSRGANGVLLIETLKDK
ncbi:MAG: TonB-dependent receptor plug domain-containing protein [Draconibacterium sp.]|nr:TonB-dependent receptor plug domain-containing protein [Draconibacterium sp.]